MFSSVFYSYFSVCMLEWWYGGVQAYSVHFGHVANGIKICWKCDFSAIMSCTMVVVRWSCEGALMGMSRCVLIFLLCLSGSTSV